MQAMFTLKQNIGIIGGKPNHAHYFIGFNGMIYYSKNWRCSSSIAEENSLISRRYNTANVHVHNNETGLLINLSFC